MTSDVDFEAVVGRLERQAEETSGLVETPIESPMLQPYEVYDQGLFDLEMVRVYARSWLWLGDTEDLVEPGDYITGTIGYQPVMVIRQEDGSVRGFLNNCRHRASGLVFESAGSCGKTMTCPYHNWAYAIDGKLIGIPDRLRMYPDGLPDDDYGLVPIRIEVAWDKLIFGCLSRKAPSFREWIAPLAGRYDRYDFSTFTRYHRELDEIYPINWKAFAENSNDDYHVRFVHRRLNHTLKPMDTVVRFEGRTCSGFKPHADNDTFDDSHPDLSDEQKLGHYADFIYPNLTPLPYPDQLILVRADPIAPDSTRIFSRIYGVGKSIEDQDFDLDRLATTNTEDTDMVAVLMGNLKSPFYRVGPASTWEGRAAHVMKTVRTDVATPLASDEFVDTSNR